MLGKHLFRIGGRNDLRIFFLGRLDQLATALFRRRLSALSIDLIVHRNWWYGKPLQLFRADRMNSH